MTSQKIAIGFVAVALFVGSMTALGADFSTGYEAYKRGDYETALRIFRQYADRGNFNAQVGLGFMYFKGQGVTKDYGEAVKWFRKAADQGWANAQANLGAMYANGRGVEQDYVKAHMWYSLAAAKGQKGTAKIRDSLAENMTPAQIAEAKKLVREWKPKGE